MHAVQETLQLLDVHHAVCLPGSRAYAPLTVQLSPNGSFGDFKSQELGHTTLEFVTSGEKVGSFRSWSMNGVYGPRVACS